MTMVGDNYEQEIRKHSWWKSTDVPARNFVIAGLRQDFTEDMSKLYFTTVELLEVFKTDVIEVPYEEFKALYDRRALVPIRYSSGM